MLKIYGASDDVFVVEEDGTVLEEIDCYNQDVSLSLTDGSVILAQYSIKKSGIWSIEVEEEGYGQYDLTEYDEEENPDTYTDVLEIDAELDSYTLIR